MKYKYLIKNIIQMVISSLVIFILGYTLATTDDLLTKIMVTLFLSFTVNQFLRNLFLILNKNNISELFNKINLILFLIYWLGFLIYWNYIAITKHDYMSILFSLPFLFAGAFLVCKKFIKK